MDSNKKRKKKEMPWGLESQAIKPGSMETISKTKLKAFSVGRMNTTTKKTPFEKKKEEIERKKKQAEEEAAAVYAAFVADFEDDPTTAKTFVRSSDTVQDEKSRVYKPEINKRARTFAPAPTTTTKSFSGFPAANRTPQGVASVFGGDDDEEEEQEKAKKPTKKISNLELFKQQLKRNQEQRRPHGATPQAAAPMPLEPAKSGGSFDNGDPHTTNLYIGNLNPECTERQLCVLFGQYGPLASVKIMFPRNEEEKLRGRMCGFVAFMRREDGAEALAELAGTDFMGYEMKAGWGKRVTLPPVPFYVHKDGDVLNSGLPFNAYIPKGTRKGTTEIERIKSSVVKVQIPRDRAARQLIHRTIEFVVNNGPEFEAALIARCGQEPQYKFLVDNASPSHCYYRWKLFTILQGERPHRWTEEPFRMFKDGPLWHPPSMDSPILLEKGVLGISDAEKLDNMLEHLVPERDRIADLMVFCIQRADSAGEIVAKLTASMSHIETPPMKKIARLFAISDILHNATAVPNASHFRTKLEAELPAMFQNLNKTYRAITGRLRAEQFKKPVVNCVKAWTEACMFAPDYFSELLRIFLQQAKKIPEVEQAKEEVKPLVGAGYIDDDDDDDDDVDGVPMDEEDVDGVPMKAGDSDSDVDGEPM